MVDFPSSHVDDRTGLNGLKETNLPHLTTSQHSYFDVHPSWKLSNMLYVLSHSRMGCAPISVHCQNVCNYNHHHQYSYYFILTFIYYYYFYHHHYYCYQYSSSYCYTDNDGSDSAMAITYCHYSITTIICMSNTTVIISNMVMKPLSSSNANIQIVVY